MLTKTVTESYSSFESSRRLSGKKRAFNFAYIFSWVVIVNDSPISIGTNRIGVINQLKIGTDFKIFQVVAVHWTRSKTAIYIYTYMKTLGGWEVRKKQHMLCCVREPPGVWVQVPAEGSWRSARRGVRHWAGQSPLCRRGVRSLSSVSLHVPRCYCSDTSYVYLLHWNSLYEHRDFSD